MSDDQYRAAMLKQHEERTDEVLAEALRESCGKGTTRLDADIAVSVSNCFDVEDMAAIAIGVREARIAERERVLAELRALVAAWDKTAAEQRGDPEFCAYGSCCEELEALIAKLGSES